MSSPYPRYPGDDGDPAAAWRAEAAASEPSPGAPAGGDPSAPEGSGWVVAGWWIRVVALILDGVLAAVVALVPIVVGAAVAFGSGEPVMESDEITAADVPLLLGLALAVLLSVAFDLWNRGVRVGARGQSLGKQAVGVHVLGRDARVLGAAGGFFRWLVGALLQATLIGTLVDLLWPLWDRRKQTVHDKAAGSFPVRRAR